MVLQNCLKISYKGLTRNIVCNANVCYEDIITKVIETFDLLDTYRDAIQIYDEHGSKFDKNVFEYFVLLFPNPQKLFFVRLDASKCWNIPPSNGFKCHDDTARTPFSISKSLNKIKDEKTLNIGNREAVPVRRQNCFLGQWPAVNNHTTANTLQSRQLHLSTRQDNRIQDLVKKRHLLQHTHHKMKNVSTSTVIKRSMRF